ncbi:hypothetical protein ACU5P1_16915 [Pseudomonas plecoglossicida]|uniref:Uncharacterized protein n=1 Tax=Pseudomonas plecoglossicida TaxID=70775 RepID=A0AAD0QVW1_PSEDL|nr:hypothetical protein [Pseudomonas plecoglossicida]AXM95601.1 hypothetical protein DVB73_07205 [Pseudomonas plecoglossicida]EPB94411.1 hypothetical protein L321_18737 [Pseudomonas plecoglossicida NB2011]QLB56349.1 hypothetical protein HAV28_16745 [Pseudomonas plecoglossicida]GLR38344.1 hypothetical protein GCM10011247_37420 [Pseudomonas plecoglossicida]
MAVSNIEMFDEITGKLFAKLYLQFPLPTYLTAEDFVSNATQFDERQGMEVPTKEAEFFFATGKWLMDAGYLTAKPHPFTHFTEAVLTAKGLEVLKAVPDSVSSKDSIGEQLSGLAKEQGREATKGLVTEALALGARFISPMIGLS